MHPVRSFSMSVLSALVLCLTPVQAMAKATDTVREYDLPYIVELKASIASPLDNQSDKHRPLTQQQQFLQSVSAQLGQSIKARYHYRYALNGVVLDITPAQAQILKQHPEVAHIERSRIEPLTTDSGPGWIGAEQVWAGQNTAMPYQGEGMVIGILDTGVNTDHPSFASQSGDGFTHQNPKDSYFGDCIDNPALCNDKLIGVYSYSDITNEYATLAPGTPQNGEDHNGHGSHVAGIAAGNILNDVPVYDAAGNPNPNMTFDQISGVAPRANIISYQVCQAGDPGDSIDFDGCPTHLVIAAVDQAIADGVDVINHSIGASAQSPWSGSKGKAFLKAQAAGIVMVHSAGNDGPASETASSDAAAPWVISVAAYTHDRAISDKTLSNFTGGGTPPESMTGRALTGSYTGPVVYAGDYDNPNSSGDPAQCLEPFPSGTFSGEIVVCDRGQIARVDKAKNVKAGGAGGYVLANVSSNNLVADAHVLPAIHIDQQDGDALKQWLNSGSGHTATIGAASFIQDASEGNQAAAFSSRGPNSLVPDVLAPTIAAPGVNIWSAYADDQPEGFKEFPDPRDYAFLDGTSMAAPHVAGAAALLSGLHPDWSPSEIRSALVLTANQDTRKEDGFSTSTPFDAGAGMVNVAAAARTGLIMSVTLNEFESANPATGGDPKTLNLASLTNSQCVTQCQWQRTLTATQDKTWTVSTDTRDSALALSVDINDFSLNDGQAQNLVVSADLSDGQMNRWYFGNVVLTASDQTLMMPVSVRKSAGNLPESVTYLSQRDRDIRILSELQTAATDNLTVTAYGLVKPESIESSVAQDSSNSSAFDDLNDGIFQQLISVNNSSQRLVAEIIASTAPDLDLFVGLDSNGDGLAQESELIESSTSPDASEQINLLQPAPGDYWVLVQNWEASSESSSDDFTLRYAVVDDRQQANLSAVASQTTIARLEPWSLTWDWDLGDANPGEEFYGAVTLGSSQNNSDDMGIIALTVRRGDDDVRLETVNSDRVNAGDSLTSAVVVSGNDTDQVREYQITLSLPDVLTPVSTDSGGINGQSIQWNVRLEPGDSTLSLPFTLDVAQGTASGPVEVTLSSELTRPVSSVLERQLPLGVQVEGPPTVTISGDTSVTSGRSVSLTANIEEPNGDPVTLSWEQTGGPGVTLNGASTTNVSFTAPSVSSRTNISLQLSATDDRGNQSTASVTVNVSPAQESTGGGGGGSLGWMSIWILGYWLIRRRISQ